MVKRFGQPVKLETGLTGPVVRSTYSGTRGGSFHASNTYFLMRRMHFLPIFCQEK